MQLRLKLRSNELLVYREKWGILSLAALAGLVCVAFGSGFYWLLRDKASTALALFCSLFVLAGLTLLVRLPRQARRLLEEDGLPVLLVNVNGITLTTGLGAKPIQLTWSGIAEVLVVEKLRLIDSDETSYLGRAVVVFLNNDAQHSTGWLQRVNSGHSYSGRGRPYLLGDYPSGQGATVATALRRFAPDAVQVRHESRAIFNRKDSTDLYGEA